MIKYQSLSMRLATGILCLFLIAPAHAITLAELARKETLKIYTVTEGADIPMGRDQTNNFKEGDKVLLLSGKGLTSLEGFSRLTVSDGGKDVPIASVKDLQVFLNSNKIKEIPAEFTALQNITFIYVMKNDIHEIPPHIALMKGLQGMYFTQNHLTKIQPEIFTMHWLRKLQLSKNQLTEFPAAIGNLTNLIHFNMSENQFTVLPDTVANLKKLRVCDFSDNQLTALPEAFGQVEILYQLRVRNNPLTALPAGFAKMPGTIDITGTKIDPEKLSPELRARLGTEKPVKANPRKKLLKEP